MPYVIESPDTNEIIAVCSDMATADEVASSAGIDSDHVRYVGIGHAVDILVGHRSMYAPTEWVRQRRKRGAP